MANEQFIVNHKSRLIHNRKHLTERCNTDQIKRRSDMDATEMRKLRRESQWYYWPCSWCECEKRFGCDC